MDKYDILGNINGEYELLSEIKTKGNSELFLLYDKFCGRKVLMKSGREDIIENEARTLSKLSGKGIPAVYGCFEHEGKAYLFRQYIEGKTLREYVEGYGTLPVKKTVEIGVTVCEIISRLHSFDPPIIHRDIKADNIILTADGEIYLIDFGISREYNSSASRDTCVMGTLSSAPPEQFGYGQTDERSDIYSLGVLLREMTEAEGKKSAGKLSTVIKKCTMFSPEDRYKSVSEIKSDLLKITERKIPKKLIAAAAAVLLCAASVSSAIVYAKTVYKDETFYYVPIDKLYLGDYTLSSRIPKSVLERYDGDIKIMLETETVDLNKKWANFAVIAFMKDVPEKQYLKSEISCEYDMNGDGFMDIGVERTECEFILSHDVIENLTEEGICFQPANVQIKSALLSESDLQ